MCMNKVCDCMVKTAEYQAGDVKALERIEYTSQTSQWVREKERVGSLLLRQRFTAPERLNHNIRLAAFIQNAETYHRALSTSLIGLVFYAGMSDVVVQVHLE